MAVFTKLSSREVKAIVNSYNFGVLKKYNGIKEGIENTNYLIQTTKGKFILTIFEKRVRKKDVPFFVKLMQQVDQKKFLCPKPLINKKNQSIFKIKGKLAILVSFLSGKSKKNLTNKNIKTVGAQIAKFHQITSSLNIKRPNTLGYSNWLKIYKKIKWRKDDEKKEIKKYLDFYKKNKPKKLSTGIIHGDLFPDNIFFKNNKFSGLIDFYFSCNGSFIYEIAIMINALCFDRNKINKNKVKYLIQSYLKKRKISKNELGQLNIICLGAAIRFFLTRKYDLTNTPKNAHINKKDPKEYLYKMRYFYKNNGLNLYV